MIYFFISILFLLSCNKESSPEQAIEDLVVTRFEKSTRSEVLDLTTGSLREQIESMDEKQLKLFLDSEGLMKTKLKFTHKNCRDTQCFLTYILKYSDRRAEKVNFKLEVKKIAEVEKIKNKWLVKDISNVKTYIDSKDEIKGE